MRADAGVRRCAARARSSLRASRERHLGRRVGRIAERSRHEVLGFFVARERLERARSRECLLPSGAFARVAAARGRAFGARDVRVLAPGDAGDAASGGAAFAGDGRARRQASSPRFLRGANANSRLPVTFPCAIANEPVTRGPALAASLDRAASCALRWGEPTENRAATAATGSATVSATVATSR